MSNTTMRKFGHPDTLICEYEHWVVQLRPAQVTLGSLVLVCSDEATAFSAVGPEAFAELHGAVADIEAYLARLFAYDKINYLMLMMVDPDVHFHVVPRYSGERRFAGTGFRDAGWPGPPDLGAVNETDAGLRAELVEHLRAAWAR